MKGYIQIEPGGRKWQKTFFTESEDGPISTNFIASSEIVECDESRVRQLLSGKGGEVDRFEISVVKTETGEEATIICFGVLD